MPIRNPPAHRHPTRSVRPDTKALSSKPSGPAYIGLDPELPVHEAGGLHTQGLAGLCDETAAYEEGVGCLAEGFGCWRGGGLGEGDE